MRFSILIPTLEARAASFERLHQELSGQIRESGLEREVEIRSLRDAGEATVGAKRNALLDAAAGEFVAFVDDDDAVAPDYVARICGAIREYPGVDCIGMKGIIRFRGGHPAEFVHSIRYQSYFSKDGAYFRPPYHLNPIRRSIAQRYRFAEISYSEDIDWALRICRDHALQTEVFLEDPLYFYYSRRFWPYQWLLDWTEPVRHALGLQLVHRVRLHHLVRKPAAGPGA